MATIKIKFSMSSFSDEMGVLCFHVVHKHVTRVIRTKYKLRVSEWDDYMETVRIADYDDDRACYLRAVKEFVSWDKKLLRKIVCEVSRDKLEHSATDIVKMFSAKRQEQSFLLFMQNTIMQLKKYNRTRTSETYTIALKSFKKFRNGYDVFFDGFTSDLMLEYESWLKSSGLSKNTTSFYMRILRAVYNRAVDRGLTVSQNPFKHVYTSNDKTSKRAIPLSAIRKIRDLDLSHDGVLDFARNMFMFSFYTRGMSFIDMAYLKKSDLKNGRLCYRRRKTGRVLNVKWELDMQKIVQRYDTTGSPYLLPIIKRVGIDERKQYANALHLINCKLKKIARLVGLTENLTMYVSRHSWASAARNSNIPLSVISEGMGHNSEKTTRIYLDSIETSIVDKANRKILNGL